MLKKRVGKNKLYRGDCLQVMKTLEDGSIDMILCDLPYGTTSCPWDVVIDFSALWEQYRRLIKKNGAIVLFGQEPFSSQLRLSNVRWFKYDWYWRKSRPAGFVNAQLKPLKDIEVISVFSEGTTANKSKRNMPYYPQGLSKCNIKWKRPKRYTAGDAGVNPTRSSHALSRVITRSGYPRQVIDFAGVSKGSKHPTQKPVDLLEYLIRTYTDKGMCVLDNTMGSGSTGVACVNAGRLFVGIEKDKGYFNTAVERIREATQHDAL